MAHHFPAWRLRRVPGLRGILLIGLLMTMLEGCGPDSVGDGFGLELSKPSGWTLVSAAAGGARGESVRYDAAQLDTALRNHSSAPLFALLKRAPPQRAFNPTFGISLERDATLKGQSPVKLLEARVADATAHGAFTVQEAPTTTRLAGVAASRAELRMAAPPDNAALPATSVRLYLMVINDVVVLLAATDAAAGDDDASEEFQQILDSLRLPGAAGAPGS